jgi:hypothetical protein
VAAALAAAGRRTLTLDAAVAILVAAAPAVHEST